MCVALCLLLLCNLVCVCKNRDQNARNARTECRPVHVCIRACVSVRERACVHCVCVRMSLCERDDRGPGGTETSVADSTPFSFYYQIIHDKQLWRLAKVRQAG